jgi:hypothetical protein
MLSIRVVPAAPKITNSQIAVFPENDNLKSCELLANGSIGTAAVAVVVAAIHTIAMNNAIAFKVLFISCPPVIKKI